MGVLLGLGSYISKRAFLLCDRLFLRAPPKEEAKIWSGTAGHSSTEGSKRQSSSKEEGAAKAFQGEGLRQLKQRAEPCTNKRTEETRACVTWCLADTVLACRVFQLANNSVMPSVGPVGTMGLQLLQHLCMNVVLSYF
eukprot:152470-Amphidinium_carterae.1